jgi:hypothetical protein
MFCVDTAKEFDIPFLARRMIINNIAIQTSWIYLEKTLGNSHLDTLELWKFGDYKHFTSLKLMCKVLGIQKAILMAAKWVMCFVEKHWPYCNVLWKDTIAVAQIFLRLRREELLIEEEIIHVRNFNGNIKIQWEIQF